MSPVSNTILVVKFATGRVYTHAAGGDREVQRTIDGWHRHHGLWVIEQETGVRVWCPWHTVMEVAIAPTPRAAVVGGSGPASSASVRRLTLAPTMLAPIPIPEGP